MTWILDESPEHKLMFSVKENIEDPEIKKVFLNIMVVIANVLAKEDIGLLRKLETRVRSINWEVINGNS